MYSNMYSPSLLDRFKGLTPSSFIIVIFLLLNVSTTYATTYYARANKDWNDTDAWSTSSRTGSAAGTIPGVGDDVIIDGRKIDIDAANVTIASLTITNAGNSETYLRMQNGRKLTVTGNMTLTAENKDKHVDLYIEDNGSEIEVQGDLTFTRVATNSRDKRNRLFMENSTALTVVGDFKIDHKKSSTSLDDEDIDLDDDATFTCQSDVYLNMDAGGDLKIELNSASSWQIDGNLISTVSGGDNIEFETKDNSSITINGNFTHTQTGGDDFKMEAENSTSGSDQIHVLGNFLIDHNSGKDVEITAKNNGEIAVNGNFTIDWDGSSSSSKELLLEVEDYGKLDVDGNFSINMNDPSNGEIKIEIKDDGKLQLGVDDGALAKSADITLANGSTFEFKLDHDSKVEVFGDLDIIHNGNNKFYLYLNQSNGGSTIDAQLLVDGDLNINKGNGDQAYIFLEDDADITVGGNLDISFSGFDAGWQHAEIQLENNAAITTLGNLTVTMNDPHDNSLTFDLDHTSAITVGVNDGALAKSATINVLDGYQLIIDLDRDSKFQVYGDLNNTFNGTGSYEFDLNNNSNGSAADGQLAIDGNWTLSKTNGDLFRLRAKYDADIAVGGDLDISFSGFDADWQHAKIQLEDNATISALGNLTVTMNDPRKNSLTFDLDNTSAITVGVNDGALAKAATINVTDGYQLIIDIDGDSKFQVYGDLNNTFNGTDTYEFDLNYNDNGSTADGQLAIDGDWTLIKTDGDMFRLRAKYDADIHVGGDFSYTSTGHDAGAWDDESIILTNDAVLDIDGSFNFSMNDPNHQNDLVIDLDYNSAIYVGVNDGAFAYSATLDCIDGLDLNISLDRDSKLQVYGDLTLNHSANQLLKINLNKNSNGSSTDAQLLVSNDFTISKTDGYAFDMYQEDNSVVNVGGNFSYTGTNHKSGWWDDESIKMYDDASFTVNKNFSFTMNDPTNQNDLLIFLYENSTLNTGTSTSHTSTVTQFDGNNMEIYLGSDAVWNNAGSLNLNYTDGSTTSYANLDDDAELNIGNNFTITNDQNSTEFSLYINDNSLLNVDGNIDISSAAAANRIEVELNSSSKLELGGSIIRAASPNNYGKIIAGSSATVEFNGSSSQIFPQELGASTDEIYLTKVIINNTSGTSPQITMEGDATVHKSIIFTDGVVSSTSSKMLRLADNGTVTSASNNSHVDGFFGKIGNNSFTFPIGNDGFYTPLVIDAPNSNTDEFDAKYEHASAHSAGYDTTQTTSRIDHVSKTEYWVLNRAAGSSNVKATLGWDSSRSGDIGSGTLCDLRITRWDGSKWQNEGNGGASGHASDGTIITGSSEDCSTSTDLTSWVTDAPITLAVDSNYITWDGLAYDGGSGIADAPSVADAGRILKVFGTNAVVSTNCALANVIITTGADVTINSGVAVTVSNRIINNGLFTLENNASLVQTSTGANTNSGSGSYVINREGNSTDDSYNIWSSPITDADIVGVFNGSNPCDIWVFNETQQTWSHDFTAGTATTCNGNSVVFTASHVITGGDGLMNATKGYFVPGNIVTSREYAGEVNNGEYLAPITITDLGNQQNWDDDDWNLLGNPYPSALSAAAFWTENAVNNSRITDALYFWDQGDTAAGYDQNDDYASWNALGGVESGNSLNLPSGHIASGQGFWVVANANSNVVFNNTMRSSTNDQFFKTENTTNNHLAWVSVKSPSSIQNNILVGYNANTNDSIDPGYDAHKLSGNAHLRFASLIGAEEFSIQGFSALSLNQEKVIPLVLFSDETGTHTFNEYKRENLPSSIKVLLHDKVTGVKQDLSTSSYSVTINGNQTYDNRFELVFQSTVSEDNNHQVVKPISSSTTTDVTDFEKSEDYSFRIMDNSIILSNQNGLSGNLKIIDATGKTVWIETGIETTEININTTPFTSGVYFIQLITESKPVYQNRIVIP